MGSSNLTSAGLGVRKSPNYELSIALKDYDDVKYTRGEFHVELAIDYVLYGQGDVPFEIKD
jgi:hypothetical protein